jgi:intracellular sulfur oxidation DsrE/DsrF family protein
MKKNNVTSRRDFMGTLAASATAGLAMTAISNPLLASIPKNEPNALALEDADAWFAKVKGKHRVVFDATRPHEIMPFVWPRVFLMTNGATGTLEKDCSVVVVLRHDAIPYAMEDRLWTAYKFGEVFKADDPATKAPSVRNPFFNTKPGDFKVPGFGEVQIGIKELQASGVMFCVCDAAMTVYSAAVAGGMQKDPAEVKKDWVSGVLPGIQIVPSGVWALGRAQEHGCAYIFAG